MKKIILFVSFLSTCIFAKDPGSYFSISVGAILNNPVYRLETVFDPTENVELGFGIAYEGLQDRMYKISLKDELKSPILEDKYEALEIIKDMLRNGMHGTAHPSAPSSAQSLGVLLLSAIYKNDPDMYFYVKKELKPSLPRFIYAFLPLLIENDSSKVDNNKTFTNEELIRAFSTNVDLLKDFNKIYTDQRNPINSEIEEKINKLSEVDILEVLPIFVEKEMAKKGIVIDESKRRDLVNMDIHNAINYVSLLQGKSIEEASDFDYKSYLEIAKDLRATGAGSQIKKAEIIGDFLEVLVKEKFKEVEFVKLSITELTGTDKLQAVKNLLIDKSYEDKDVFILSEAIPGEQKNRLNDLKDKISNDVANIKKAFSDKNLFEKSKNLSINTFNVVSHNLDYYFYVKEKFGKKGRLNHYFRQDLGLMHHISNPYRKLSAAISLGYGLTVDDHYSFDVRLHTLIPIISNTNTPQTFRNIEVIVPEIFKASLNFTYRI